MSAERSTHDPDVDPGPAGMRVHDRHGAEYVHVADLIRFLRHAADEAYKEPKARLGALHLRFACDYLDLTFASPSLVAAGSAEEPTPAGEDFAADAAENGGPWGDGPW